MPDANERRQLSEHPQIAPELGHGGDSWHSRPKERCRGGLLLLILAVTGCMKTLPNQYEFKGIPFGSSLEGTIISDRCNRVGGADPGWECTIQVYSDTPHNVRFFTIDEVFYGIHINAITQDQCGEMFDVFSFTYGPPTPSPLPDQPDTWYWESPNHDVLALFTTEPGIPCSMQIVSMRMRKMKEQ